MSERSSRNNGGLSMGRRDFLKAMLFISGAAVVLGMLRGLEYLMPPSIGISSFPRLLLVDENGNPIKASKLPVNAQPTIALFPYPLNNEPNFLLNLGNDNNQPVEVPPTTVVIPQNGVKYEFPGGVGPSKSIVAFSAICQHLGCTFPELTFYPPGYKTITALGPKDKVLHCSCHGSTYDPYLGGAVVTGPTVRPLPAVVLEWDPSTDQLYAVKMVGPVIYGHPGYNNPTQDVVNNPLGDLQGGSPISGTSTAVTMHTNPAITG
ncbi:Rieske 2Fe-2S domain-containing protein [Vulcanisaeta distributa]|uniref:Rieske (2Fe-2S) iron-sulfur domain protein n=1 Tax=Vulcanisaeta distributa (strain DSM 14429 / JCM 11212 / NBRC 100878 / IC-017) TaxID=572478 RepID=E1QRC2_VULDI|nr:Rieske 2Fe-2S domain-containing protein [Vulcanisaeta distributa]ADN50619.1 Rieske (2Fe-2S) iron-sulfur domain protein [Vulcanisaeta distributa DSM 14429]